MKIKRSEKKTYLQYRISENEKICLVFKSPQKTKEFIDKNKIRKEDITYLSFEKFPFKEHYSSTGINHVLVSYYGSNRTTKRFKEVM